MNDIHHQQLDHDHLAGQLSELLSESVTVDSATKRELDDTRISIVDMSYYHRAGSGDTSHRVHVKQTAVVLEQQDLRLPDFTLRPSASGVTGALQSLLGGMGDINFDDSPQFSDNYFLHGWIEDTVRELFTLNLRNYFAKDARWTVRGSRRTLVIYHHNKRIEHTDQDQFVQEALAIMALFQQAEEALDARPDLRRETRPEDMTATAQRMGGVVGSMLDAQLNKVRITRSELEAFAKSGSPRRIPDGMKRQVIGQWLPVMFAAAMMVIAGIVFAVISWTLGEGNQKFIAIPIMLSPVIGCVIIFYALRHRARKVGVLRDGVLHRGTVASVARTETQINNQQQYAVAIDIDQREGTKKTIECKVLGTAGDMARSMKESGAVVRVLVDPNRPTNTLCLDLLMISEG